MATTEDENFIRISILLTEISSRAVRVRFDKEFHPLGLERTVRRASQTLRYLKDKRVINNMHWRLLFPRTGKPDSKTFDVTLMITLLRHLASIFVPDQLPDVNDFSIGADLGRIKFYRNQLAHPDDIKIDNRQFEDMWTTLTEAIRRLGGIPLYEESMRFKHMVVDRSNHVMIGNIKQASGEITNLRQFMQKNQADSKSLLDTVPWNISDDIVSDGTYKSYDNTVYLSGACKAGKSTLASVFLGHEIPLKWNSTDGLVIYFGQNGINLDTKEMVPLKEETNLFAKVLRGNPEESPLKADLTDPPNQNCDIGFKDEAYSVSSELKEIQPSSSSKTSYAMQECYKLHKEFLKGISEGTYEVKIAPSDLVDFGGQPCFDMTHQLFIRQKGTFVVIFDGRYGFDQELPNYPKSMTNKQIIKNWVNFILVYCVEEQGFMPMIVFAATHSDYFNVEEAFCSKQIEYKETLKDLFGSHVMRKHIELDTIFFIDARKPEHPELKRLQEYLVSIAMRQPSWGERKPIRWIPLEVQMARMQKDQPIVKRSDIEEANQMNEDLTLSDKQLSEFLAFQHSTGKIMYYNLPGLEEYVVLYPPSLVNILRSFITDTMFFSKYEDTIATILQEMYLNGKITKKQLQIVWEQEFVPISSPEIGEFIINLLVHLDVLIVPRQYITTYDVNCKHSDVFLVPCIIKEELPLSFLDENLFQKTTMTLILSFKKITIPPALAYKLIGAIASIWPLKVKDGRALLYQCSAVLSIDTENELRILVQSNYIIAYLTNRTCKYRISPDLAASIQEGLVNTLNFTLKFYNSSIGNASESFNPAECYELWIGEVCNKDPCVISAVEARTKSEWTCKLGHCHNTDIALRWLFDRSQKKCSNECKGLNKSSLGQSVDDLYLIRLATRIGVTNCRELILHLGLDSDALDDLEFEHKNPLLLKFSGLKKWQSNCTKPGCTPCLGDIKDGLSAIGDERHHLCMVLRHDYSLLNIASTDLQHTPDNVVLRQLARHMGNVTVHLGIELGLSVATIEETIYRYSKDLFEQTYDILKKWTQVSTIQPTIFRLMEAVNNVDKGGLQFLLEKYTNSKVH